MSVDVGSLLLGIMAAANAVQKLGNDWYVASDDWKKFPFQIEYLRKKAELWQEQATNFGLAQDRRLMDPLDSAFRLLEEEMKELVKKTGSRGQLKRGPGFVYKLKGAVFPAQLGQRLNNVTLTFDNIPKIVDEQRKISTAMQAMVLDRKMTLPFSRDPRYVRLKDTERKVRMALLKPDEPKVVLLYGGTGRGKSTLAQDLALQIESPQEEISDTFHEQSSVVSSQGNQVTGEASNQQMSQAFERVIYMKCGPDVQLLSLQRELRQKLGWNERELQTKLGPDGSELGEKDAHLDLERSLSSLLHSQKVLLIFDDVWSADIHTLQSIISLCGKNVKCLVTSQDRNLCHPLNCNSYEPILMGKASPAVGRKIFASHVLGMNVRMKGRQIPANVEGLADALIDKVDGNLLAMACLATAIDSQSFNDERAWEKVADDFLQLLYVKDTARIHSVGYNGGFWAAMEVSFENLTKEEKKLLILVNLCRGSSVPEEVVEYLYKFLKQEGFSQFFLKARAQLEARQLIQVDCTQVDRVSWSIHSLLKKFIDQKHKTDELDVLKTLRDLELSRPSRDGENQVPDFGSEFNVTIVLMGLYLHDTMFTQKVVSQMSITMNDLNILHDRRYVIEALTRLLISQTGKPNRLWDTKLQSASRRVFLFYVQHGWILEDDAIILLKADMSLLPMVNVLQQFALKTSTMASSVGEGVLFTLFELLGDNRSQDGSPDLQKKAVSALASLASYGGKEVAEKISNIPGLYQALVNALTRQVNPDHDLQMRSAETLEILARTGGLVVALKISNTEGAVETLADSLTKDDNPGLRKQVAWALGSLAWEGGHEVSEKLCKTHGLLEKLVKSLSNDDNPVLQEKAAIALGNLAYQGGREVVDTISNVLESLQALVSALTNHSNPYFPVNSARALEILARKGGNMVALKISDTKGAVKNLADSLTRDDNPSLQKQAAWALSSLAWQGGHEVSKKICNTQGLVEKLVSSLSKDGNPGPQEQAARALANLANQGGRRVVEKISNVPGAFEALVLALTKHSNPKLQRESARALEILASKGEETVALKISDTKGALQNLAYSLTKDDNPSLQKQAAWALSSLAWQGGHDLSEKICMTHGLVETLISSLSKDDDPGLQERAAGVLAHLAYQGGRGVRDKILQARTACESLTNVVVMAKDNINSQKIEWTKCLAMRALFLIDPVRGQALPLKSASAYLGRGCGKVVLGLHEEALKDLNDAWRIQASRWDSTDKVETLRLRVTAKTRSGDLHGALEDADSVIEINRTPFTLRERGVVKHMMGNFSEALMDLDEGFQLEPDIYETLKHRGFVKFCMKDEDGARADAKRALDVKPPRTDFTSYGCFFLGEPSVQYLGFQLR